MGSDSGFWTDLRNHAESIGILAAFVTIIVGTYRVWTPAAVIERNHERVTAMTHWVSQGTWLALMQSGVRWVLRLMEMLYGPPREGNSKFVSEYLTVRAWKMSAWIAALLLFVIPPLLMAIVIPIMSSTVGEGGPPWYGSLIMVAIALVLAAPFMITWRTIRRDDEFSDHHGVEDIGAAAQAILLEGTKIAIVPSLAILIGGLLAEYLLTESTAFGIMMTIFSGSSFLALLTGLIRAIRRHGFLAPLAFVAIIIVVGVYCTQSLFLMIALVDGGPKTDIETLFLIPAWILTAFNINEAVKSFVDRYYYLDIDIFASRFLWIIAITGITVFFSGRLDISEFVSDFFEIFIGSVFIVIVPFTISAYAAIYSNSIPDWLSIALTRSVLSRAAQTNSLQNFLRFLLIDLVCVIALCLLTFLIMMVAFTFASLMISFASDFSSTVKGADKIGGFFSGGIIAPFVLTEWLIESSPSAFTEFPEARAGASVVLVLTALSLTSLIPTLLNACVILGLIVARCLAMMLMPPFKMVYGLLLIDENNTPGENKIKLLRSSILIAMILAFFCFLLYSILWFGLRWLA
jgi:hypothetical protein